MAVTENFTNPGIRMSIDENAFTEKMTKTLPNRENALIELISSLTKGLASPGVRVGIGDDAAVLAPPSAALEMLVTTDQIVESTHFVMGLHPPGALGAKALTRGVSDIAAMGGRPSWFTLSLGVPEALDFGWIEQFLVGMFSVIPTIAVQGFPLVGGDVARAPFFAAHVTATGVVERGRAMLRSAARPGDGVFVSGRLGGSALGLERLLAGGADEADPAVLRHISPVARVALGQALAAWGVAAALDLSDGLSTDALRLAGASNVSIVVDAARVPRFPGAGLERALHGGEEYELLFAAPAEVRIPREYEGLELTRIGRVEGGEGLWLAAGGAIEPLIPRGFEHFKGDDR